MSDEIVGRYLLQKMLHDQGACRRCYGAGLVVKKRAGGVEPWLPWALLPPGQNLGVISANIQPMICRACKGSGERVEKEG